MLYVFLLMGLWRRRIAECKCLISQIVAVQLFWLNGESGSVPVVGVSLILEMAKRELPTRYGP